MVDSIEKIIEEILREFDSKNNVMVATEIKGLRTAIKQLSELISQQRALAVEKFVEYVKSNTIGGRFMSDDGTYFKADAVLRKDIDEFLKEGINK